MRSKLMTTKLLLFFEAVTCLMEFTFLPLEKMLRLPMLISMCTVSPAYPCIWDFSKK